MAPATRVTNANRQVIADALGEQVARAAELFDEWVDSLRDTNTGDEWTATTTAHAHSICCSPQSTTPRQSYGNCAAT